MDEISYGPKREFRPPPRRWLIVAGVACLATIGTALGVTGTGGHRAVRQTPSAAAPAGPAPSASFPEIMVVQAPGSNVLIVNGPGALPPSFRGVVMLQVIRNAGRS